MDQRIKTFYDLCSVHGIDADQLDEISKDVGVPPSVVFNLFQKKPIRRSEAEKILARVSELLGQTWMLNMIPTCPLLPYYYQHCLEFSSPDRANEGAEKLLLISCLGTRVDGCTLIFYTKEPLRKDERGPLFQVLYPQNFTLDSCIDGVYGDHHARKSK